MTHSASAPGWLRRLLRVGAGACAFIALAIWVTPMNVSGRNLVPVGCGSPAAPETSRLTDFICSDHMSGARANTAALALAAGALLVVSEIVLARVTWRSWFTNAAVVAVIAFPMFALSGASLFTTIAKEGADGTLLRCGSAITPANDAISRKLCADLPARQKALALFGLGASALAVLGAAYVAREPTVAEDTKDLGEDKA